MESARAVNLGSSLLVPSVQELARERPLTIPIRYVRHDVEPLIGSETVPLPTIPVIDMQKLILGESANLELGKLDDACQKWGFFQLVNHGISSSLIEKMKFEIQAFFNLPLEEKMKFWQHPGAVEGFGQAFVVSEEQKLDWGDMFFLSTLPIHQRKSHLFPNLPQSLRETLEAYSLELQKLAMNVLKMLCRALEMAEEEMKELFEDGHQSMRMNYYPPCPQPELTIGQSPHSDSVGLTLLLQVNEIEGLEIRKEGLWIPIKPLPNAFIVNIGDILEIVSNGIYRSIEHRAKVNSEKERLSIATFYSPKLDKEMGPAPSLINPQRPALFKRVGVEKYFTELFTRKLQGKAFLDSFRN
eukprot:TRINITY_DN1794_c1_g1_i1.p1 TRINITY_DN1794_c1_g1~~TRINITY_DN1794_c1_g1_i1.p1  ORF type:complete len:373 (-),score=71.95 TRINITY_DN1794_c1_g1_i1:118-1185(-)